MIFEIIPSEVPEEEIEGESHECYVRRLAELKAIKIAENRKEALVIGADTIVILGPLRLGKPSSKEEARKMLEMLSGQRHEVLTGFAVLGLDRQFKETGVEKTGVWFKKLTPLQIEEYLATSEPFDKAGGYGIQGRASRFIAKIEGELSNVIGLPLDRMKGILEKAGVLSN